MGGFVPIINPTTGKITGYKTDIGGADTVFPFTDSLYMEMLTTSGTSGYGAISDFYFDVANYTKLLITSVFNNSAGNGNAGGGVNTSCVVYASPTGNHNDFVQKYVYQNTIISNTIPVNKVIDITDDKLVRIQISNCPYGTNVLGGIKGLKFS